MKKENKIKENKIKEKKSGAEVIAKIVWIIGAVLFAIYAISTFASIGSDGESIADCIKSGIAKSLYLVAYVCGLAYLFRKKKEKAVFIGTVFYAAAYAFNLICELLSGSTFSADDLTSQVLSMAAYIVFAVFAGILMQEQKTGAFLRCLKLWYLPPVLLFLAEMVGNLWMEFVRPGGFLMDGFILDTIMSIVLVIPVLTMMLVIKKRRA